jgi:arabinose-5-phosphate isomerase
MHGDIGIIQKNDVVILLSKSGESPEVKGLLPLLKSRGNRIIAIVGNLQSQLAKQSDVVLNGFVSKEACPNNLAPTSSTIVQMALGDALAVCMMELKNFSSQDFAQLHPGGNLGKRLYLRVSDIYKNNAAPKVAADADLKKVILTISKGRMGATAVADKNNIVKGIITDGDVRRLLEKTEQLSDIKAKDILSSKPKCIFPESLAMEALELMKQNDVSQLIVIDQTNHFLGFIHLHDLIREGIF